MSSVAVRNLAPDEPSPVPLFQPSRWISTEEVEAACRHPRMPGAVASFAEALIERYRSNAILNAILSDRGRIVLGLFVLYLDVHPPPWGGSQGATLGNIQELCRRTRLCSPGRATSMLAAMRFAGYVSQQPDPRDSRRRVLTPTPRLLGAHVTNWTIQFLAMSAVYPQASAVLGQVEEPRFRREFLGHLGTDYLDGFRVIDHVPLLSGLAESNAGLLMLSSVAMAQLRGEHREGAPIDISISALARRFKVSRAHVRNMLVAASQLGLVERPAGLEGVVPLPALPVALMRFYAVMFTLFNRAGTAAMRAIA